MSNPKNRLAFKLQPGDSLSLTHTSVSGKKEECVITATAYMDLTNSQIRRIERVAKNKDLKYAITKIIGQGPGYMVTG